MAEDEVIPTNPEEMRKMIISLRHQLRDKDQEMAEFQEASHQLEEELEADLKQKEKSISSLKRELDLVQKQLSRKNSEIKELNVRNVEIQENLSQMRSECSRLADYIRELEQYNDDLERRSRQFEASLSDYESKLHQQIERNVFLENELGEKEHLEEMIQRLKDEARDLKGEIAVQQSAQTLQNKRNSFHGNKSQSQDVPQSHTILNGNINGRKSLGSEQLTPVTNGFANGNVPAYNSPLNKGSSITTPPHTPQSQNGGLNGCNGDSVYSSPVSRNNSIHGAKHLLCNHLSPSTRLSALNIVSDLLRKVGALENKLATCSASTSSSSSKNNPSSVKTPSDKSNTQINNVKD